MNSPENPTPTRAIVSEVVTAFSEETTRVVGGYARKAQRIVTAAGIILAALGAFIAGIGNAMSKTFGYGGDTTDIVPGGEIFIAVGIIIAITGILLALAPVFVKKWIKL